MGMDRADEEGDGKQRFEGDHGHHLPPDPEERISGTRRQAAEQGANAAEGQQVNEQNHVARSVHRRGKAHRHQAGERQCRGQREPGDKALQGRDSPDSMSSLPSNLRRSK